MTVPARAVLALALLAPACKDAGATASTPPSSETQAAELVTFGEATPAVGMQRRTERAMLMQVTLQVDAGGKQISMPFSTLELESKREEILELDGSKVTKLRVTYDAMESKKRDVEGEKVEPSPVVGKRYIVSLKGGRVTVVREGRGKMPNAEREIVAKDYGGMGNGNRICKRLRDEPRAIGDAVELGGDGFSSFDGSSKLTLTLRGVEQQDGHDWAQFDARLSLQNATDEGEISIDLAGKMVVDVSTCSAEWFEGEGPLAMRATAKAKDGTPMKMQGSGTAKFTNAATLWQAPASE